MKTETITYEIEACYQCPHYDGEGFCCHPSFGVLHRIVPTLDIPTWCPLEDKEKTSAD